MTIRFFQFFQIVGIIWVMTGCASTRWAPLNLPEPLRSPVKVDETVTIPTNQSQERQAPRIHFETTPKVPSLSTKSTSLSDDAFKPSFTSMTPLKVNIEGLPLPAFINEVFGNLLGLSFEIAPPVQQRPDLVTLRVSKPQQPAQLYDLVRQVLTNYGVSIQKLPGSDLMRFMPATEPQAALPALIASGLTLPEVPPTHRPIFHLMPLKAIAKTQIIPWLQKIYQGYKLEILPDETRNAIILLGSPHLVSQAVEVVNLLDQPLMQGQYSLRIEPAFLSASALAARLTQVLQNQGYSMTNGSINLLPIDESNTVIVFAVDEKTLTHIQQWAEQLDRFNPQQTEKTSLFFYGVKNTAAAPLANTLNALLGEIISDVADQSPNATPTTVKQPAPTPPEKGAAPNLPVPVSAPNIPTRASKSTTSSTKKSSPKLAVDEHRNALIFVGTGEEWARLLPILQEMDKPAKQVLIEATIAEITLTDKDERGIEWVINNANLGGLKGRLGTIGLGTGGTGLTYTLSSAAQVRAVLNAFTSNNRATILQTPRLLVRSGSSASINVGSEIPTLTSQAVSDLQQEGNSAVLQQIQYRSTGISLNITPIVYAGRRIDLTISQQVSESQPNESSKINSPVILNRQIDTELTLSDGRSVLLGGVISNNRSEGWSGVPFLSELPVIGQLFRVNKASNARTELVVLIIPYVIDDDEESAEITEAIKQRLKLLPAVTSPSF